MGRKEVVVGVCLMLFSAAFYILTYQFPRQTLAFSPKIFPRFVSACLFVVSCVFAIQGTIGMRRHLREKRPEPVTKAPIDKALLIRMLLGMLIGYVYTGLLPVAGYIVATPPFIASIMLLFGERRWFKIVASSIVTSSLLYILFRIIFKVPLPRFSLF